MRHGHAMTSFQVSMDCIWLIVIGGVANQSDLLTSSNSVMVFELGKKHNYNELHMHMYLSILYSTKRQ